MTSLKGDPIKQVAKWREKRLKQGARWPGWTRLSGNVWVEMIRNWKMLRDLIMENVKLTMQLIKRFLASIHQSLSFMEQREFHGPWKRYPDKLLVLHYTLFRDCRFRWWWWMRWSWPWRFLKLCALDPPPTFQLSMLFFFVCKLFCREIYFKRFFYFSGAFWVIPRCFIVYREAITVSLEWLVCK